MGKLTKRATHAQLAIEDDYGQDIELLIALCGGCPECFREEAMTSARARAPWARIMGLAASKSCEVLSTFILDESRLMVECMVADAIAALERKQYGRS